MFPCFPNCFCTSTAPKFPPTQKSFLALIALIALQNCLHSGVEEIPSGLVRERGRIAAVAELVPQCVPGLTG